MFGSGSDVYLIVRLLDSEELESLKSFLTKKSGKTEKAEIYDGNTGKNDRSSKVTWFSLTSSGEKPMLPAWFIKKIKTVGQYANNEFGRICPIKLDSQKKWRPKYEDIQYSVYPPGGHYGAWHTDASGDSKDEEDTRCLSIVLLLQSCEKGGEFQVKIKGKQCTVFLEAGDVVLFPAKHLEHRVTKCLKGVRKSLVTWIS